MVEQDPHRGVLRQAPSAVRSPEGEHSLTGGQRHRRHTEIGVAGETASVRAGAGVRDHVVSGIDGRAVEVSAVAVSSKARSSSVVDTGSA